MPLFCPSLVPLLSLFGLSLIIRRHGIHPVQEIKKPPRDIRGGFLYKLMKLLIAFSSSGGAPCS